MTAATWPEHDYFAVADPFSPGQVTFWTVERRRGRRSKYRPWPPKAKPGPRWTGEDRPRIGPDEPWAQYAARRKEYEARQRQRTLDFWARRREYEAAVVAAIDADVRAAALRFARHASRCCACGRVLTDEQSKCYGIGPECRRGVPPEALAFLAEEMGRLVAVPSP